MSAGRAKHSTVAGAETLVIVNADDLGSHVATNEAIFTGMEDGVVTSATLMANGRHFDEAVRQSRRFRRCSFGAHLNITNFAPLTTHPGLATLLAADGTFNAEVYHIHWTRAMLDAVENEWMAQARQIQAAGVVISHLDSHHHVHNLPVLLPVLKRVQRATGVRKVRNARTIYPPDEHRSLARRVRKRLWQLAVRRLYATRMTDEFSEFLIFLRLVRSRGYGPPAPPHSIELMVHPTLHVEYAGMEGESLRSGWMEELPFPARLGSYFDL